MEAISGALRDTTYGLTGSEIQHLIASSRMTDPGPITKRIRIYNAFVETQNSKQNRTHVLEFTRLAMKPARYSRESERYEPMRALLNQATAFAGLVVDQAGTLTTAEAAQTLPEAQRRARELRAALEGRGVHPDVLAFCGEELLADNYFHAVQEAVKSVADKMRTLTGLTDDGATLVDRILGGDPPPSGDLLVAGFPSARLRPQDLEIVAFESNNLSRSTVSFSRGRRWQNVCAGRAFRRN